MRSVTLCSTIVVALICALWAAAPAWAQPNGSYLRTCRDLRVAGKYRPDALLTAECQTRKGYWRESSLYYIRCPTPSVLRNFHSFNELRERIRQPSSAGSNREAIGAIKCPIGWACVLPHGAGALAAAAWPKQRHGRRSGPRSQATHRVPAARRTCASSGAAFRVSARARDSWRAAASAACAIVWESDLVHAHAFRPGFHSQYREPRACDLRALRARARQQVIAQLHSADAGIAASCSNPANLQHDAVAGGSPSPL